jgi:hypothetical protein
MGRSISSFRDKRWSGSILLNPAAPGADHDPQSQRPIAGPEDRYREPARAIAEDEAISIRAAASGLVPEWLQSSWDSARQLGVSNLSAEEIEAEIAAARKDRIDPQLTARQPTVQQ